MSATIRVECPSCGVTINAPKAAAGSTGKCPRCKSDVFVPMPDDGFDDAVGEAIASEPPSLMTTPPIAAHYERVPAKKYPALELYAKITVVAGWLSIGIAMLLLAALAITTTASLVREREFGSPFYDVIVAVITIGSAAGIWALAGLACLASAELIRLAIDIEKNTRGAGGIAPYG